MALDWSKYGAVPVLVLVAAITLHVPSRLQAADSIVVITGGTTKSGFRIELDPSGTAKYFSKYSKVETRQRQIPQPLVQRFYATLNAAQPLNSLQTSPCIKSVSFGYRLYDCSLAGNINIYPLELENTSQIRVGSFLRSGSASCTIVTIERPSSDQHSAHPL